MPVQVGWEYELAGTTDMIDLDMSEAALDRRRPGRVMLRRLLPRFIISLLAAGAAIFFGAYEGALGWQGVLLAMLLTSVGLFAIGVTQTARELDKAAAERDAAERTVREHDLRYRLMVDTMFDGIVITQNGLVRDANPGYAAMFGYDREELIGKSVYSLVADESREKVADRIRSNFDGGYDVVGIKKDGTRFTFDTVVKVHGHGDHQIRVAALRDTTEKRALEEQLRQSQKMEAIGNLAGGVAHDFNNLLTVILGYSEMMLLTEETSKQRNAENIEQLTAILEAGQSAAGLTRQLLAFSRQQVLRPQVLSLNSVVANSKKLLGRLIGEDVVIDSVESRDLRQIKADPGQLEQVLMNLAVNARDAMPNGGTLIIETSNIDMDASYSKVFSGMKPGRYVQLSVTDSGTGMNQETQHRIFEPFFTTKEVGKGTGLGLASVYGIVQQSGGHIWVYSELGHGTTFKLYFPAIDSAEETPLAEECPFTLMRGSETVLLVEDADAVRHLAETVLKEWGYTVLSANGPKQALALEASFNGAIQLMLTDVVMPMMNGRELADVLCQRRPDMKVLFMSGYTSDAVLQRGILGPDMTLLQKPFSPPTLARAVREVLDRARQSSATN